PAPRPDGGGGEQPAPEPGDKPMPAPKPEPAPEPEANPEVGPPVDPGPAPEPEPTALTLQLEERDAWLEDNHPGNGNPLKTEGGNGGTVVANTFDGAWLHFGDIDLGEAGMSGIDVTYDAPTSRAPADVRLELRLGSPDGELAGTLALPQTGDGWGTYETVRGYLDASVSGVQDLYIVLRGTTDGGHPYLGNFDRVELWPQTLRSDYAALELERYDEWSTDVNPANNGPLKTEGGQSGDQVANTFDGAWLAYKGMQFGAAGVNEVEILYAGNAGNTAADAAVQIRLGAPTGELVGTVQTPPTGGGWGTYATATAELTRTVTGTQDLYLFLTGTTDGTYRYIGNFDRAAFALTDTGG
ncbi:carbohydrate-binding protein, partial [Paenibacillus sp. IB182496]